MEKNELPNFLGPIGRGQHRYRTLGLEELATRYAMGGTYSMAVEAVKDVSGEYQLSDQKIASIVTSTAVAIGESKTLEARKTLASTAMPLINTAVDIYSAVGVETLMQVDAILVKEQKGKRDRKDKKHKSFVSNTIALLENKEKKGFDCLIAPLGGLGNHVGLKELIQAKIIENYGDVAKPLNIVAINDGAKDIRELLLAVYGVVVVVILDWYHLGKKVKEYSSMFGMPLQEKKEKVSHILHVLWEGKVGEAIDKLNGLDVKNKAKRDDLIGYLEKHKTEIIDYGKRQKAGKTIGSGLVENMVNQIVGRRQKGKGMSWSANGSRAIAILRTAHYNNEWEQLWTPRHAA